MFLIFYEKWINQLQDWKKDAFYDPNDILYISTENKGHSVNCLRYPALPAINALQKRKLKLETNLRGENDRGDKSEKKWVRGGGKIIVHERARQVIFIVNIRYYW